MDLDLEKFFDRVNHDILMFRLALLGVMATEKGLRLYTGA